MLAYFHSDGTIPSSSDNLNTFASGLLICSIIFEAVFVVSHQLQMIYYLSFTPHTL